jgi:hypothetical protein
MSEKLKLPLTLHGYDYAVLVDAEGEFVADFGTKAKRPATALAAEACRKLNVHRELATALHLIEDAANSKQPATRIKTYVARIAADALNKVQISE